MDEEDKEAAAETAAAETAAAETPQQRQPQQRQPQQRQPQQRQPQQRQPQQRQPQQDTRSRDSRNRGQGRRRIGVRFDEGRAGRRSPLLGSNRRDHCAHQRQEPGLDRHEFQVVCSYRGWRHFVLIVGLVGFWAKTRAKLRATVYLFVVFPAVGLVTAAIVLLPTTAQLVTLRAVALSVLVFTPALMWWLFIATQRASLLNEFIANLDRLGLLDRDTTVDRESAPARETRISSYLQKFEATYGALPEQIRHDVVDGNFRSIRPKGPGTAHR